MFDLFITDLDGTLLDDDKKISQPDLEAIKTIRQNNIAFSVFTGRNFYSAYEYMNILQFDGLAALQNGALVIEMPSRKVVHEIRLKSKNAAFIYSLAKEQAFTIIGYNTHQKTNTNHVKDMVMEKKGIDCKAFEQYYKHNKDRILIVDSIEHFLSEKNEIGQLAIIGKEGPLRAFQTSVEEIYKDEISHVLSPVGDQYGFLEFFGPKVSKGVALNHLLARYNTTAAKTVFIGDNYNDIPLMKKVGLPVAPENAHREIKDHCKMIVSSNNNHAVKEAIQKIFF